MKAEKMIAVDTNILVYAHRKDSTFHHHADRCLTELAERGDDWAIPFTCLHEFFAIVTHPRIFKPPTPIEEALKQVDCWLECPGLRLLGEGEGYWKKLKSLIQAGRIKGPAVHDARVAATCLFHAIDELWSADRDFSRFAGLAIKNPLVNL